MKKLGIIFLTIFIALGISGCQKYTTYTEVDYSQFKDKLEAKDTFVLVIGSATCSACKNYKITMDKVIKDKQVEIFYIDLNKLSEEDYANMYSQFVTTTTPTTIFFKEGEQEPVINRIVGSADYDTVVKELSKRGYIGGK